MILNCKKYKYKADIQKKIWLNKLPNNVTYFHIIGDKEKCNEKDYIFDNINNILYVNTDDDYNSLPSKVINAINAINETYDYKYILKTDDDQILINENYFTTTLSLLSNKNFDYAGFFISVPDHVSTYYKVHDCLPRDLFLQSTEYCNGRFYALSTNSVKNLLDKKNLIEKCIIEDHSIGLYLDDKYKNNILKIQNNNIFIDIEKFINDNFIIYTECVNCPEIVLNSIVSFLKYHKYRIDVYLTNNDKNYLDKYIQNKQIRYIILNDQLKTIYNSNGHLGTAHLWANVINNNIDKKLIHIDSDTILRGNIIDDIIYELIDHDLVGPYRCYKNNLNDRDDIRDKPDVVSTYCFGFNPTLIDKFDYKVFVSMIRGFYNPLNFPILDFFDPICFNILKNNGKISFIDFNIIGGMNQYGDKNNKYSNINNHFDVGDKIIHFSSVGSGINFKKSLKENITITVPKFYQEHSLKSLAIYKYLLFNIIDKELPDNIKNIKKDFSDLKLIDFIEINI